MTEPILTQDEVAAIRDELADARTEPTQVSFSTADRKLRQLLPTLSDRLQSFAETAAEALSQRMRSPPQPVAGGESEISGPEAARPVLERPGVCALLSAESGAIVGVVVLPNELAWLMVDVAFGAPGSASKTDGWRPERTRLSALERDVALPFLEKLARDCAAAMALPASVRVTTDHETADLSPALAACEALLLWRVQLLPSMTCAVILLPAVSELIDKRPVLASAAQVQGQLTSALGRVEVQITANLGHSSMTIAELLALRPGDIVRLDRGQADTVPVLVEGAVKFLAKPIPRNGTFGVVIQAEAT